MKTAPSLVLAASLLPACGGVGAHSRASGTIAALTVRPVEWNPSHANVGRVRAVADSGDEIVVFSDGLATVIAGGQVVATDRSVKTWTAATTIPGADGSARWIVGVDGDGNVRHLRARSAFENVSARYALTSTRVRGASPMGEGLVGFLLDGEVAVADGAHVSRFAVGSFPVLTGGGGIGAGASKDAVVLFDIKKKSETRFELPDVTDVVVTPHGRLFAATSRAVYAQNDEGRLALLYEADGDTVHGLAASGERVWFADGEELGVVEGASVSATTGAHVATAARLAPSSSGDVWVFSDGTLQRFAPAMRSEAGTPGVVAGAAAPDAWQNDIAPVFARACSACHGPNGSSGVDLSSAAAWRSKTNLIEERVVARKSMPPPGHPIADTDRQAIQSWLASTAK